MYFSSTLGHPAQSFDQKQRLLRLLIILSLLLQSIVAIAPPVALPIKLDTADDGVTTTINELARPPLPLPLPVELIGKAEVTTLRTLDSATFDLGNGQFARFQETIPLHYQDRAGTWQRINPAYQRQAGRWVNNTNTVRTALDRQSSAATINAAGIAIRWQPQALELVSASGASHTVVRPAEAATATPNATNDAVRYQAGWTASPIDLPWLNLGVADTIDDQWQSRPGSAEYTMRLTELPAIRWWQARPEFLDLHVQIDLQPGTTLKIDGSPVDFANDTPLATRNPLIFVDANGEELLLQPPVTYEQHNRHNAVQAEYIITPVRNSQFVTRNAFELRVRTPWPWLAAPERQFPVIIDPVFQMRAPYLAAEAIYNPDNRAYTGLAYTSSEIWLGRTEGRTTRAALRFDLPVMPQGTQINKAWLYAVPSDFQFVNRELQKVVNGKIDTISAYAIQNDNWINGAEPAVDLNAPIQPSEQRIYYSAGQKQHPGVQWDVTALAQQWLSIDDVIQPENKNHGILLRLKNEFCDPSNWLLALATFCGTLHFDISKDAWAVTPDLATTQTEGYDVEPHLLPSETGGIRLVVFYSNSQTLVEGAAPIFIDRPGNGLPQSGDKNAPYYAFEHRFNVANPPARWQAVVARSFAKPVGVLPPVQAGVENSYRLPLTGTMQLDLRSTTSEFLATSLSNATGEAGKVSYLLINGRGTPYPDSQVSGILPLNVAYSPPANAPANSTIGYDIRLLGETGNISVTTGVKQTIGYTFDSSDPLAFWNLQLPVGSNAAVRVQFTGDGTQAQRYRTQYANQFEAKIIRTDSQGDVRTSNASDNTIGQNAVALDPNRALSLDLDNVQAKQHALAIRYNGPKIAAYDEEDCGAEICSVKEIPIKYQLQVEVLACPAGTFPTNSGKCQKVECPSAGDLALYYRDTSEYGLWSRDGWNSANENNPVASTVGGSAPLLGPLKAGAQYRAMTVAVIGGQITYNPDNSISVASESKPEEPPKVRLLQCPPPGSAAVALLKTFPVFNGALLHSNLAGLRPNPAGSGQAVADPWPIADRQAGDFNLESFVVEPAMNAQSATPFSSATGSARVRRVAGQTATRTLYFRANWAFTADGWPSLSSEVKLDIFDDQLPDLASLIVKLGDQVELDTTPANGDVARSFTAIRAKAGTVTQQASLGGASKPVQIVILPRGVPIPIIDVLCPASCVDLRGPSDVANSQPDRVWAMPDVHTNVAANTMIMQAAGVMEVYSTDHPTLMNGANDAFSKEFSFDAYKATVTVDYAPCGGVGPEVLIIKGETSMALPNIGNTGTGGLIAAGFTLCEASLRSVRFNFESPIGLPIGSSGLFMTGVRGEVSIFPEYTQIKVGLNFQAAPGGNGGIFKAWGEVTIDTRGLFEFGGGGKVLGVVDADGKLWVAWNPLDTGFEVNVRLGSWFRGFARAHLWQGQGWQNRYAWLPDNDEMHFAGEIGATITIEESAVMWLVPPGDIDIGIEVAFGQFCTNGSCTTYEWGIKGKVVVAGFDVGVYYGFDEGLDFILGNDDHLLIDEYGGQIVSAAALNGLKTMNAPQKLNGTAMIPFTVSPSAEQILVGLSWQAGSPALSLINPDGAEITVGNIASFNGQTDGNANITLLTLQQPKAGAWQAKLSNLSEAGVEHYRFLYFANKGAPGPVGNHGKFLTPVNANEAGTNSYTITWEAPADATDKATISLFYERTLSDAAAIAQTGYITGNLLEGAPIVQNLPFKTGSFQWNTVGLLDGEYRIRAVVDDGVNALPSGQVSVPLDMCQPQPNGLPTARAFDPERFPGTVVFTSTGTIRLDDVTPPAMPTGLTLTPADGALLAKWDAVSDPDVSAYLVRWGLRSFNNPQIFFVKNQKVVAAPNGQPPQLYIGAVDNGKQYGVDVTALDINGNASAQTAPVFATPDGASLPVPFQPISLTLASKDSTSATFTWQPNPIGPTPASYHLRFVKVDNSGPVGSLDVSGTSATIPNLQTGATYDVQVVARNSDGWSSVASERVRVVVSNGSDGNGDGLPDDWATANNVSNSATDSDGDGLNNAEEYVQGSDPNNQDSDGDNASDGEEKTAQSDPLDSSDFGLAYTQPRLALERNTLHFTAKLQAGGEAAPKLVGWRNVGGGNLQLQAGSAESWIMPSIVNDKVQVTLNSSGLTPGFYSGVVRLNAAPGSDSLIGADALGGRCIRVNTWVLPADNDTTPQPNLAGRLYLPLIQR